MSLVNPNEIIDAWNSVPELVVVISDAPRRDGQANRVKQIVEDAEDQATGDIQATTFAFEFLDGDGNPINFPVTLVSETKFKRT